jgi:COP9 signalosome complex subunit 6
VKAVHKNPPLDLVGWYTLVDRSGPSPEYLPLHRQILEAYNESAILLGVHIQEMPEPEAGVVLPFTIYESNLEAEDDNKANEAEDEDKEMRDMETPTKMVLKFRELPYTVETGEAEMIAMQFVRQGAANAAREAIESSKPAPVESDSKGKRRPTPKEEEKDAEPKDRDANLSKEEAELISVLQTKANAIKAMKVRINVIIAYIEHLPPQFVASEQSSADAAQEANTSGAKYTAPHNNILRQISALVTNMNLVTPAEQVAMEQEMLRETNDIKLIKLIKDLMANVNEIREASRKFSIVEAARNQRNRSQGFGAQAFSQSFSLDGASEVHA